MYEIPVSSEPRVPYGLPTETDTEGHFLFVRVPPGRFRVSRVLQEQASRLWMPTHSLIIEVEAGETKSLIIDESSQVATSRKRIGD